MGSEFALYEKGLSYKDTQDLTKLRIEHEAIFYVKFHFRIQIYQEQMDLEE